MAESELNESASPEASTEAASPPSEAEAAFLEALGDKIGLRDDQEAAALLTAVAEMVAASDQAAEEDLEQQLDAAIAELDRLISAQVNEVMHHEKFQALEGTWRGLEHMVYRTTTSKSLRIQVLNADKPTLYKSFQKWKGKRIWDHPLYHKFYKQMLAMPGAGAPPMGCLISGHSFDHSAPDLEILRGLGTICSVAEAPFIASTAPTLFGYDSWQQLQDPADLARLLAGPEYAGWSGFRESEESRWVGLTLPRFLSRLPYGEENPVDGFAFEEDAEGHDERKFCWSSSSYAFGANITRAFAQYGWCAEVAGKEGGGLVEQLPIHAFPNPTGNVDVKCPTEIAIDMEREMEISSLGLIPLSFWPNTDQAVFVTANSLHEPKTYTDPQVTASDKLASELPHLFPAARIAHYLKKMLYEKINAAMSHREIQTYLNNWLLQYHLPNADGATTEQKAKKPIRDFKLAVTPVEGAPGVYEMDLQLATHTRHMGTTGSIVLRDRVSEGG